MDKKTVIITGGSSGIGRACALRFAAAGYQVVICGRDENRLTHVTEELKHHPTEVLAVKADVGRQEDCRHLIESCLHRFGRVDVLINNAGVSMRAAFHKTQPEVLHTLMNTNFWGTVYCTQEALPHLLQTGGVVVGISSIAGRVGLPGRTLYSASKFAMEGFLEALRIEYLHRGLHVLVVCPGFTESNIRVAALTEDGSPQGYSPRQEKKMMSAAAVADRIFQAVIQRHREIILTVEGKTTLWLKKFFPALLDRLIYRQMKGETGSPF
jgi:NAD(P)-dependent dehydrogenase (short-subunit alcohol dehydrogenase family)